jgi:hypothetical protein
MFGTTGSAVQWLSNLFSEDRPAPRAKDNPLYGSFITADVPRGREDLFYDFKGIVDNRYETFMKLLERGKDKQADEYYDKYSDLIASRDYVVGMEAALRDINRQIRNIGEIKDKDFTAEQRRQEITDLQRQKNDILDGIIQMRLDAGL